jgi:ABC-type phosphate transport system substrate-binding protein
MINRRTLLTQTLRALPFAGVLAAVATTRTAHADALVVVLNARNPTKKMSPADLKAIYLGTTAFWNGTVPMKVLGRLTTTVGGKLLLDQVMAMSAQAFAQHWTSRQLAGQGVTPESLEAAADVVKRVASAPGAIGVVAQSELSGLDTAGVKLVQLG